MSILEILEAHSMVPGHYDCRCGWERTAGQPSHRAHVAEQLEQHMQEREAQMRQLIRDMTDPGKCWFDHRGGCQEHGYLTLKPGELCPHAEAMQLLGEESSDGR